MTMAKTSFFHTRSQKSSDRTNTISAFIKPVTGGGHLRAVVSSHLYKKDGEDQSKGTPIKRQQPQH
jgi:hypothetical protein